MLEGIYPDHISRPIDATWRAEVDEAQSEEFFAFYEPQERAVWFCYVVTGATKVQKAICYELDSQQWTRRTFRNTLQCAISMGLASGSTGAWVGDGDGGYIWLLDDERLGDGLPTSMSTGVVTCTSGCTTTVLNVAETLSTSPTLVGAILYDELNNVERRITANTANTITITPALSGAPAAGREFYIGSIHCELRSDWATAEALNQTMNPIRLQVDHLSDEGAVEVLVATNVDFSATDVAFTRYGIEPLPRGIDFTTGDDEAVVDTSVVGPSVPVNFKNAKCMRWGMIQRKPTGVLKLLNMRWQFPEVGAVTKPRTE